MYDFVYAILYYKLLYLRLNKFNMRSEKNINLLKCAILQVFFIAIVPIYSQTVTVTQDAKFEQLLNEKRKSNSSLTLPSTYKIQIFSGTADESKKYLIAFKKEYKNYDSTILFNTPIYKVIVGNFTTRIEAERNFNLIKKTYPNALLVKPYR